MSGSLTSVNEVALDPGERAVADRDHPVTPTLALRDQQHATGGVDIVEPQSAELAAADPGRVEHLHDRPVTQPDRILDVGAGEHRLDLGVSKDRSR